MSTKLSFLGAVREVTGSCALLQSETFKILIDCGIHQGKDAYAQNRRPFPFNPKGIDAVLLTHAHIDHSGLIPRLVAEGFNGTIYGTPATLDLAKVMLQDSAEIALKDLQWLIMRAKRQGEDFSYTPLYSIKDVTKTFEHFEYISYHKAVKLSDELIFRFSDAGHILGSAMIEIQLTHRSKNKKIVFSGDIGKKQNPIVNDPQTIKSADVVIVESTYANRLHKDINKSLGELAEVITDTFKRGGNVYIPSFAIGRTQDLIYYLNQLAKEGKIPIKTKVYIDSPMAMAATDIYFSHRENFDIDSVKNLLKSNNTLNIRFTHSVRDSQQLNSIHSGIIVIAGSGMCEGGRIVHHFKHNLWRKECSVIFVGFQAAGTLGRKIIDGASKVHLLGQDIAVKARIYTIGGFSAHADRDELLSWLAGFETKPDVFIVHGEEDVSLAFQSLVQNQLGYKATVPVANEIYEL